jgi:hypothetical protein
MIRQDEIKFISTFIKKCGFGKVTKRHSLDSDDAY